MIRKNQQQLVHQLRTQEKYRFTEFELVHEGDYETSDADWNYKDVPHLTHVHKLVEGYPGYVGDDFISALLVQKVLGLKFPAVLFNYQSAPNKQTYFITMLIYILIVETSYESLGKNRTRVRTRYAIGCRSWLASRLFPLARFAIRRNYNDLMSGDIPMRERRGWLRKKGYTFKGDNKPYSFFETSLITEVNVLPPTTETSPRKYRLSLKELTDTKPLLLGEPDQYGLSVHLVGQTLNFFLRLCPHEGSDLSKKCDGKIAICEWHGRRFNPEFKIPMADLQNGWSQNFGTRFKAECNGPELLLTAGPLEVEKPRPDHVRAPQLRV